MTEACSSCSSTPSVSSRPLLETPAKSKPDAIAQDKAQAIRKTDAVQFSAEAQRLLESERMYGAQ